MRSNERGTDAPAAPAEPKFNERVLGKTLGVAKEYGPVVGGMGAARLLNFVASALLARALGVAGFGAYAVGYTLLTLLSQGPNIIDSAFVKHFVMTAEKTKQRAYLRAKLQIKLVLFLAIVAIAVLASPFLSEALLPNDQTTTLMTTAVLAGGFLMLAHSGLTYLQAQRLFVRYGLLAFGLSAFGLALLGGYLVLVEPTPLGSMLVFNTVYYGAAAVGVSAWLLRASSSSGVDVALRRRELIRFSGWMVPATVVYTLLQRIDVLIIARLSVREEVGLYGGAVTLAAVASIFTSNLATVFLPKAARFARGEIPIRSYALDALLLVVGIVAVIIVGAVIAPALLRVVLGPSYVPAASALRILLLTYGVVALQPPLSALLFAIGRTFVIFIERAVELTSAIVAAWLLVPRFGAAGAAGAMAIAYLAGTLVLAVALARGWSDLSRNTALRSQEAAV